MIHKCKYEEMTENKIYCTCNVHYIENMPLPSLVTSDRHTEHGSNVYFPSKQLNLLRHEVLGHNQ